jgi:hypothetical protein
VVQACLQTEATKRPGLAKLLEVLKAEHRAHDQRKFGQSVLGQLGKLEKTAGSFWGSSGYSSLLSGVPSASSTTKNVPEDTPQRMVRLDDGRWVQVDGDLLDQFPDDEVSWRRLMALRAQTSDSQHVIPDLVPDAASSDRSMEAPSVAAAPAMLDAASSDCAMAPSFVAGASAMPDAASSDCVMEAPSVAEAPAMPAAASSDLGMKAPSVAGTPAIPDADGGLPDGL